jgi:hypothetical protein
MFLEEGFLVSLSEFHDVSHVDFIEGGEESISVLRVLQVLSNLDSHSGHLHSSL